MTTKQLSKLENRIATLKQQNRIVWIEGINAEVIKGKVAGKSCYFVKAESLNENGGHWYYIVRWEATSWRCTCEATKPCKHERNVNALMIAKYEAKKHREAADRLLKSITGEDLRQHVEDDLRVKGTLNGNQGFSLLKGETKPASWLNNPETW